MTEDPNWWLVKNSKGRQGMIPANYVELVKSGGKLGRSQTLTRDEKGNVTPMPWFHGKITRDQAEELLQPRSDGLFMIRESTNYPGDYTLCVWYGSFFFNLAKAPPAQTLRTRHKLRGYPPSTHTPPPPPPLFPSLLACACPLFSCWHATCCPVCLGHTKRQHSCPGC